jgi:hypothetical protein
MDTRASDRTTESSPRAKRAGSGDRFGASAVVAGTLDASALQRMQQTAGNRATTLLVSRRNGARDLVPLPLEQIARAGGAQAPVRVPEPHTAAAEVERTPPLASPARSEPRRRPGLTTVGRRLARVASSAVRATGVVARRRVAPRSAANAKVPARRTAGSAPAAAGSGYATLQRSPDFGLADPKERSQFAQRVLMWKKKYPSTTLDDFATILLEEVNQDLRNAGVPSADQGGDAGGGVALFQPIDWTISIDIGKIGKADAKVSTLGSDTLAYLAVTLYHEARHAEQEWLRARRAAAKSPGKDAKTLARGLLIKETIVQAAVAAGGDLSHEQAALADKLSEFRERYGDYKVWVESLAMSSSAIFHALPHGLKSVYAIIKAFKPQDPTILGWKTKLPWLDRKIGDLTKKAGRDSVDSQVLKDMTSLRTKLQEALKEALVMRNVIADWDVRVSHEPLTAKDAERVRSIFEDSYMGLWAAVGELSFEAEAAYEREPAEVDTRKVSEPIQGKISPPKPRTKPAKAATP